MLRRNAKPKLWETRSSLRYGSKHEGFFDTKERAILAAEEHIKKENCGGYIKCEVNGVIYYNPHCTREQDEEF